MYKLISITVTTRQWSSGHHAWFDARLKPYTTVEVRWGDGTTSVLTSLPTEWSRVEHYYRQYESDETYVIEFWSRSPDALLQFQDGLREMAIGRIELSTCPALRKMCINHLRETDFTGCPSLEILEAINCDCKVLDLRTAPELRSLACRGGEKLETLILTGNNKLEELDCRFTPRLTKVTFSNRSVLRRFDSYMTEIDGRSMAIINRILERNNHSETSLE